MSDTFDCQGPCGRRGLPGADAAADSWYGGVCLRCEAERRRAYWRELSEEQAQRAREAAALGLSPGDAAGAAELAQRVAAAVAGAFCPTAPEGEDINDGLCDAITRAGAAALTAAYPALTQADAVRLVRPLPLDD